MSLTSFPLNNSNMVHLRTRFHVGLISDEQSSRDFVKGCQNSSFTSSQEIRNMLTGGVVENQQDEEPDMFHDRETFPGGRLTDGDWKNLTTFRRGDGKHAHCKSACVLGLIFCTGPGSMDANNFQMLGTKRQTLSGRSYACNKNGTNIAGQSINIRMSRVSASTRRCKYCTCCNSSCLEQDTNQKIFLTESQSAREHDLGLR